MYQILPANKITNISIPLNRKFWEPFIKKSINKKLNIFFTEFNKIKTSGNNDFKISDKSIFYHKSYTLNTLINYKWQITYPDSNIQK